MLVEMQAAARLAQQVAMQEEGTGFDPNAGYVIGGVLASACLFLLYRRVNQWRLQRSAEPLVDDKKDLRSTPSPSANIEPTPDVFDALQISLPHPPILTLPPPPPPQAVVVNCLSTSPRSPASRSKAASQIIEAEIVDGQIRLKLRPTPPDRRA